MAKIGIASSKNSVWLYAHRLTRDSFSEFKMTSLSRVAFEERQLTSLAKSSGPSPSAKDRKALAEQEAFVEELRSFLDEVKRVAPFGTQISTMACADNFSVSGGSFLIGAWQKEVKGKWDELVVREL